MAMNRLINSAKRVFLNTSKITDNIDDAARVTSSARAASTTARGTKASASAAKRAARLGPDMLGPGKVDRTVRYGAMAFGIGAIGGIAKGLRGTMIDANNSLGNPVGFTYDYSLRRTFDSTRSREDAGTTGLTNNLPKRSNTLKW